MEGATRFQTSTRCRGAIGTRSRQSRDRQSRAEPHAEKQHALSAAAPFGRRHRRWRGSQEQPRRGRNRSRRQAAATAGRLPRLPSNDRGRSGGQLASAGVTVPSWLVLRRRRAVAVPRNRVRALPRVRSPARARRFVVAGRFSGLSLDPTRVRALSVFLWRVRLVVVAGADTRVARLGAGACGLVSVYRNSGSLP